MVSGGFDIVHSGHIRHLEEAKKLGDILIVILNSDNFLINKKGYLVMKYEEREEILKSLRCVDVVIPCKDEDQTVCKSLEMVYNTFEDDNCELIFANGGDRNIENVPEKSICDKLGIKMVFGVGGDKINSSSQIVNRLKI